MTLAELPLRQKATIVRVLSPEHSRSSEQKASLNKMLELGLVPGTVVEVTHKAPWGGDPLVIHFGYSNFSLTIKDACLIQVEPKHA